MPSVKESVCSFPALYRASEKTDNGVLWKDSVVGYSKNRCANLYALSNSLMDGTYRIDPYIVFKVHEPKQRTIVATRYKDRVFQRSLCDNYLTLEVSRHFVYDNCACLKGKGTDFARKRLKAHLQRFYRKHGTDGYVLSLDIRNFFGGTRHDVAKRQVGKLIRDRWARERVFEIIDSFEGDVGIGLGSQISQLIELSVLNGLDHAVKERLGVRHYVRYMDDVKVIHESKERLAELLGFIKDELAKLGLEVNVKKTFIAKLSQPTKFLGFSYRLTKTGGISMTVCRESVRRAKRRMRKQLDNPRMSGQKKRRCVECYMAHAAKGSDKRLPKRILRYYERRIEHVRKEKPQPKGD